ncbi:MAG TPA: NYN domain-containing protein, partial [Clostridiales bacterium]|nr:NYN domain-containing protein [Clostridiales bacterium]
MVNKYLLVDGYNIINAWRDLFDPGDDLELNRSKLIDMLIDFAGNKEYIVIIVFDAQQVKGGKGTLEERQGLIIVFTEENETADNYIEKFVYEKGSTDKIAVATSDYMEQRIVLSSGGARITPKELRQLLV